MNVPDSVWEKISWLLDLAIKIIPVIIVIFVLFFLMIIVHFVKVIRKSKQIKRQIKKSEEDYFIDDDQSLW